MDNEENEELASESKSAQTDEEFVSGYEPFADVLELLDRGDVTGAQTLLETFEERGAEWYYVQAQIYRKRKWFLESKKSIAKAITLEPENEGYKKFEAELNTMTKTANSKQKHKKKKRRLGFGRKGDSAEGAAGFLLECCCEALCFGICEGICEGGC